MTDPATAYVLARLAELEALQAPISGQPAHAYDAFGAVSFAMLPPPDEDTDVARRIALYRRWLARNTKQEETK